MKFIAEMTDTFGGEANYTWVNRKEFEASDNASDSSLIRRAKKALEITGRHKKESYGDDIRLDFFGVNVCCFIYPVEGNF